MTGHRSSWGPGEVGRVDNTTAQPTALLDQLEAAANAHAVDAFVECFTPDYDNVASAARFFLEAVDERPVAIDEAVALQVRDR